jgi:hypothetical protein
MRYRYQAVYRVRGLALSPRGEDILLYEEDGQIKVTLTRDPNPLIPILERGVALPYMLLLGMIGNPLQGEYPDNLRATIAEARVEREKQFASSGFVVVEIDGDVEANLQGPSLVLGDFLLCFDAYDKKALTARLQPQISNVLSALRMTGGEDYHFDPVLSGAYLIEDTGRIVHSVSAGGGRANIYFSRVITADQVARMREDIALLRKDLSLERLVRLHAYSLDRRLDNFRAFHAAWNAMEILVNKIAPTYLVECVRELADPNTPLERKEKLEARAAKLAEKVTVRANFELIASYLGADAEEADIAAFPKLKKQRDRLNHGQDIVEDELPTGEVHKLFDKYLRNHLRR